VVGAIAGGLVGKGVSEMIDPTAENAYWRERHPEQPYARGRAFEDYETAYRAGYTGYRAGKSFADREADLRMEYEGGPQRAQAEIRRAGSDPVNNPEEMPSNSSPFPVRGDQSGIGRDPAPLPWHEAREAARAAYERVERGEARRSGPESDRD
jgi:hypothetical protein